MLQAPSAFPHGVQVLAGYLHWRQFHRRAARVLQLDLRSSQARGSSPASTHQGVALLQAISARCVCRFFNKFGTDILKQLWLVSMAVQPGT